MGAPAGAYRDTAAAWSRILQDPKGRIIAIGLFWFVLKGLSPLIDFGIISPYTFDLIFIPTILFYSAFVYYESSEIFRMFAGLRNSIGRKNLLLIGILLGLGLEFLVFSFDSSWGDLLQCGFKTIYLYSAVTLGIYLGSTSNSDERNKLPVILLSIGTIGGLVFGILTSIELGIAYSFMVLGLLIILNALGAGWIGLSSNQCYLVVFLPLAIMNILYGEFSIAIPYDSSFYYLTIQPIMALFAVLAGHKTSKNQSK